MTCLHTAGALESDLGGTLRESERIGRGRTGRTLTADREDVAVGGERGVTHATIDRVGTLGEDLRAAGTSPLPRTCGRFLVLLWDTRGSP